MYAGAPLSLGAFRGQVPDADRPYRMPWAAVLAPFAFIFANLLIYWSGFEVIWKLGIVLVIGYVLIGISMAFDKQRPPLDWKSAQWLPVYLIGMGIISWQGQYSGAASPPAPQPPTITINIPFWWDMVVVAGFSLIIYYWAQYSRLPPGGDARTWSTGRQEKRRILAFTNPLRERRQRAASPISDRRGRAAFSRRARR